MDNKEITEILYQLNYLLANLAELIKNDTMTLSDSTLPANPETMITSVSSYRQEYLKLVEQRNSKKGEGNYLTTGFAQLDELIGGFFGGELIIIGGRPGSGKTSMILSIILNQLRNKIPVALYSLELTKESLVDRLVTMINKIPASQLKTGILTKREFQKIEKCIAGITDPDLYMMDMPVSSCEALLNQINTLVKEKGVRILYLDYLQLMIPFHHRKNREQEVSELMRLLKSVAVDNDIPVVIASQMNRNVEWRGGAKKPLLSDLRESGTIEEIADKVIMIYRPELFGILCDEEGNSTMGRTELIVAKNRSGATDDLMLHFKAEYGLFENIMWDKNVFPSLDLPDNPFRDTPY